MSLTIHPYTIKICKQSLNVGPNAKDEPFFYEVTNPNLKYLTQDQLDYIYSEGKEILEIISTETFRRIENVSKTENP